MYSTGRPLMHEYFSNRTYMISSAWILTSPSLCLRLTFLLYTAYPAFIPFTSKIHPKPPAVRYI